ncbi:MAG TPA: vitamin K epoxide reductase family protein [Gaiellaceae bacterium]|nr:vitamin K epoxide reductase family protein [Gaiellaceae bacterium]
MTDRSLRASAAAIAIAGAAVAAYLTWSHFADTSVVCVVAEGCETVQESAYAELAGVPVALLGLVSYLAVLALVAWDVPLARLGAAALALVGLVFGLFLLAVQLFVIDALCTWCVVNDAAVGPLLALVTALRLRPA